MNTPTKITVTRIAAIVLMIIALFVLKFFPELNVPMLGNTGINLVYLIVFVVFLVASFTDFLDGYLARKNNQVTDLGKFLDPVADKLLINSMVIFLISPAVFAPYVIGKQTIVFSGWCAIILIARDIIVDALRFIAAQKKIVIAANIFGKAKTVLQMVAISFVLLNGFPFNYFDKNWPNGLQIADILVYIATLVSFISGVIYVWQNRKVFSTNEKDLAKETKELLESKGLTLSSVESFTGGKFASSITKISGASHMFRGAMVTYATEVKHDLLDIDNKLIEKVGVVSSEVASLMAKSGKEKLKSNICVSFTGNAGPNAMEGKPVGEVYLAFAYLDKVEVEKLNLEGKREKIQEDAIKFALKRIIEIVNKM